MVASRGSAERIIEEERFGGMEEGDSSGIVSVIVACLCQVGLLGGSAFSEDFEFG